MPYPELTDGRIRSTRTAVPTIRGAGRLDDPPPRRSLRPREVPLVDGGDTRGTWVANITDPCDPTPTERYAADGIEDVDPDCWSASYNEARGFAFAADSGTGAYTFDVSAKPARGEDGGGPEGHFDLEAILDGEE